MKRKAIFAAAAIALLAAFAAATWLYERRDGAAQRIDGSREHLVREHSPTLGDARARVQIVEFLDPACETCARFYPMVKRILSDHPGQVQLVLRWAPFHEGADAVVAALEAARRQGQLWPALEALLASQAEWAPHHTARLDRIWRPLDAIDLDLDRLRAEMGAPEIARAIAEDLRDAKALGVTKTPTFFVNGEPLPRFGYGPLVQLVNDALQSAQRE